MTDAQAERKQIANLLRRNRVTQQILEDSHSQIAREVSRFNIRKPEAFRWSNNKLLEGRINNIIGATTARVENNIAQGMVENWNLANQKYDHLANQYFRNSYLSSGATLDYFSGNYSALNSFVSRSVDGMNLSKRVWGIGHIMKEEVNTFLGNGIIQGTSANEMARQVKSYLNDPDKQFRRVRNNAGDLVPSKSMKQYNPGRGKYRSSFKNAQRLTRTEMNMAYRTSDYHRRKRMDFVTGIEVHLSGAHPEIDICDEMAGRYPKNFKFLGWHPNCFCYTTSILLSEKEFMTYLDKGVIPGKKVYSRLPQGAYQYVDRMKPRLAKYKNKPYWLKDNFKGFKPKKEVREFTMFRKGATIQKSRRVPPVVIPEKKEFLYSQARSEDLKFDGIHFQNMEFDGYEEWYNSGFAKYLDTQTLKKQLDAVYGKGEMFIKIDSWGSRKSLEMRFNNYSVRMDRTFQIENGKLKVSHDYITLSPELQGGGRTKKAFQSLVKQYEAMGVQEIHVHANINVGGYAWAKYQFKAVEHNWGYLRENIIKRAGKEFNSQTQQFVTRFMDKLEVSVRNTGKISMASIAELEYNGQKLGKGLLLGDHWNGVMDMTNPEQYGAFKKYLGL